MRKPTSWMLMLGVVASIALVGPAAPAAKPACGRAIEGTVHPLADSCTFVYDGKPLRVWGVEVAGGVKHCGPGDALICPADAFIEVSIRNPSGGNFVRCGNGLGPVAACEKQKSIKGIARGTTLTCRVRAGNTADKPMTRAVYRCSSGSTTV